MFHYALVLMIAAAVGDGRPWQDRLYPARVTLSVHADKPGVYEMDVGMEALADLLDQALDEPVTDDHLSRNAVVAVLDGRVVGRCELAIRDENLVRQGDFRGSPDEIKKAWSGYQDAFCSVEPLPGGAGRALVVRKSAIANHKIFQRVALDRDARYLLSYRAYRDTQLGTLSAGLHVPDVRWYSHLDASYAPSHHPLHSRTWETCRRLYRASQTGAMRWQDHVPEASLSIGNVIIGEAAIGSIRLQRARWRLVVDLPKEGPHKLDVYFVATGGHRFDDVSQARIVDDRPLPKLRALGKLGVESLAADDEPLAARGGRVEAWTLPATHPLIAERLARSRPERSSACKHLALARGEDETLVLVLRGAKGPWSIDAVTSDLPLPLAVDRLESIPVWEPNSLRPEAPDRVVAHRYDAMVRLAAPSPVAGEYAVLALTLRSSPATPPGTHRGQIVVRAGQDRLALPLEVTVLPAVIRPMRHFKSLLGGGSLVAGRQGSDLEKPSLATFDWHGIDRRNAAAYAQATANIDPQNPYGTTDPVRFLASHYVDRLLDFHLQPKSCAVSAGFTYKAVERPEREKPELVDWDFAEFNRALQYFVDQRGATSFIIAHVSNHLLCTLRTHSPRRVYYCGGAAVAGAVTDKDKKELPADVFWELVGDYYEAIARNLAENGWLGRAYILIDETRGEAWWQAMERLGMTLKSRPNARFIRILHTMQGVNTYTMHAASRGTNPLRLTGGAIDVWCPENDDEYNALDPRVWPDPLAERPEHWAYFVRTEAYDLDTAGVSNYLLPLKLRDLGCRGMHAWEIFAWGAYPRGQRHLLNPWDDCRSPYGNGALSFFYPPRRDGPAREPVYETVPSFRLVRMRDGIEDYALADVLQAGIDDAGQPLRPGSRVLEPDLARLWINPVQWYRSAPLAFAWSRALRRCASER